MDNSDTLHKQLGSTYGCFTLEIGHTWMSVGAAVVALLAWHVVLLPQPVV